MPDGHRLVHDLLTAVAAGDPADHADASGDFEPRWVGSDNGITVRGLLWSACALDAAAAGAAVPAIATAATLGRAVDERAVNAAIDVLGRRGPPGEAALRELQRTVQGPPRRVRRIAAAIGP
ncbi:hypothetical protein OHA72_53255 [Dactylosporangium sp. NBC_01737]|uniref:hypothetical protein n=1 Tax=Dactylosporangium sp. NBC_01737 TaxID=2975959 RepID=UPI002E1311F4|nr:hypothetical protein OHA72_53255 [Dactylosporangium sp. NBC_01737]